MNVKKKKNGVGVGGVVVLGSILSVRQRLLRGR